MRRELRTTRDAQMPAARDMPRPRRPKLALVVIRRAQGTNQRTVRSATVSRDRVVSRGTRSLAQRGVHACRARGKVHAHDRRLCGELWRTDCERCSSSPSIAATSRRIPRYDWDVGPWMSAAEDEGIDSVRACSDRGPVENCGEPHQSFASLECVLTLRSGTIGARLEACTTARGPRKP